MPLTAGHRAGMTAGTGYRVLVDRYQAEKSRAALIGYNTETVMLLTPPAKVPPRYRSD